MQKKFTSKLLVFMCLCLSTIMSSLNLHAQVCTGTPVPGNTLATSINPCPSVVDTFSIQNASSLGTSVTFQWYTSSGAIAGATNATYSLIVPASALTIWCDVTCSASSLTASSTPITVNASSFMNCYCVSKASTPMDEDIYNVTVNGSSTNTLYANSNSCTNLAPGPGSILQEYSSFLSLPPLTTMNPGMTYTFSIQQDECNGAPYFANRIGIWIDYNHSGTFDPTELVYIENTNILGPRTATGTFTIPLTATMGNTVMRVVCTEGFAPTACGIYAYGETEDYLIDIAPSTPSCTGPTNPGNTIASVTGVCSGGTCNLSLQYPPTGSLMSLQWYNSTGIIAGATNATYSTTVTATDYYYCEVTCITTGTSINSSPVTVLLNLPNTGASSITACDSYTWNGTTYTFTGVYVDTFTNVGGCDSVHTMTLTINQSTSSSVTQTGCDYYLFNGTTYTSTGNYTQTYTNAVGCDSVIYLNLTINQSTDSLINAVSCNLFSMNGQTYTTSGTYTQNYTSATGCDSIVTLNVVIDTLNATITINGMTISTPNIGTYQWIDCSTNTAIPGATSLNFIPAASGSYAVEVTTATCVDTSICINLSVTGMDQFNLITDHIIYPNPTRGVFEIQLQEDSELLLLNNIGETILQNKYAKGKHSIDISKYAKGNYFLKMKAKGNVEVLKVVKD